MSMIWDCGVFIHIVDWQSTVISIELKLKLWKTEISWKLENWDN